MLYKKGFLAVIVVLVLVSISMFPVINGDIESKVVQDLKRNIRIDGDLYLKFKERLKNYYTNQDCGCIDEDIIHSYKLSDVYPLICLILLEILLVLSTICNLIDTLGLGYTFLYTLFWSSVIYVVSLVEKYCGDLFPT